VVEAVPSVTRAPEIAAPEPLLLTFPMILPVVALGGGGVLSLLLLLQLTKAIANNEATNTVKTTTINILFFIDISF
jgi:hypothetical protein